MIVLRRSGELAGASVTAAALALATTLLVARALGLSAYVVMSGSMEPAIPVGSLLLVAPEPSAYVRAGDVVTFALADGVVTHRVVDVQPGDGGPRLVTKGDANTVADPQPVQVGGMVGTPRASIPGIGFLVVYAQSYWRLLALIAIGWLLLPEGLRYARRLHPARGAPA